MSDFMNRKINNIIADTLAHDLARIIPHPVLKNIKAMDKQQVNKKTLYFKQEAKTKLKIAGINR